MPGAKSVNTVFVFPVVRLLWGPEPKFAYFFVCPHKGALHTSVIKSNPRSLSVVTVLNVDIFFLIVNRYQIGTHRRTVWFSCQPWGACATCEVTVTTKITPSWLANICEKYIKRLCRLEIPTHLVHYRVSSPQAFKRLRREHGTIEKREKWRQASRGTGDEAAPTALWGWYAKQDEKEENKTNDAKLRVSGNPFLSFFVVFILIKWDKPGVVVNRTFGNRTPLVRLTLIRLGNETHPKFC